MPLPEQSDEKDTSRIEAFSDGVFGIAITLLVLELKTPHLVDIRGKTSLAMALAAQWPAYLSYALSFVTILIMWVNHHRMFRHIRRTNHAFLMLNGMLLMAVTVVPFPTAVLSEYLGQPEARTAAAFYSGVYVFIAALFTLLWRYASRGGRLLLKNSDPTDVAAITRQYRFGPLLYLIAFLLSFVSAPASVGVCMALAAFFALPHPTGHPRPTMT